MEKRIILDHQPSDTEREQIRMQCHLTGYEITDFDDVGYGGKPFIVVKKKAQRKTKPKARFF